MVKTNGRLFTFGCSLTRYHWPTWADILGQSYKEFYNWANRGAGNRQIFERFSEFLSKTDLSVDDVIVIQWTDFHRFDYHIWDEEAHETWYPGGSLFANVEQDPMKGFVVSKVWEEESYKMHSFNFIHAAVSLARNTPCKILMTFSQDFRPDLNMSYWKNYKKILQNSYWIEGDMYNWLCELHDGRLSFSGAKPGDLAEDKHMDYHPTPIMYYKWLKEKVSTKLGIQIDLEFATKMQNAVQKVERYQDIGQAVLDAGYDTNKHYVRGY
jgi:hypothetical protein